MFRDFKLSIIELRQINYNRIVKNLLLNSLNIQSFQNLSFLTLFKNKMLIVIFE